jgi:peroxiredoxin
VEELPDLARFYRNYKSRGVEMIGVSFDDEETADQTVPPVLRRNRVEYPVLVVKQNFDQFADRFDKEWRGEVPRFYLYDKSGKRVKAWSGKTSYATLEAEVRQLLQSRR